MQSNLRLKPKVRWDIMASSFKMGENKKIGKEFKEQLLSKIFSNMGIRAIFTFTPIVLLSLCSEIVRAYDFEASYQGTYFYFNHSSSGKVSVTYNYVDCYRQKKGSYHQKDVIIPATITKNGITYKVTSIGASAFQYCNNITSVTLPHSIDTIYGSAFVGCSSLTSIPNSVTKIDKSAFEDCSSLTSIEIPNSVNSIYADAFNNCFNLDTMIFKSETPPYVSTPSSLGGIFLFVPCNAVNNYKDSLCFLNHFRKHIYSYPSYDLIIEQIIFQGDTIDFVGNKLTTAGIYKDTLQTVNGCDSIVTMKLFTIGKDTITVIKFDTINTTDTLIVTNYDTITKFDTINSTDTLIVDNYIHDTTIVENTINLIQSTLPTL